MKQDKKKRFRYLMDALGIAGLTALAIYFFMPGISRQPHRLAATAAPNFTLPLLDGGTMELASHRGEDIVILDFWATWCGPCRAYMPIIESIAEDFAEQGVVLYAVNSGESPELVREYVKRNPVNSAIALDLYGRVSLMYEAEFIPQTVVVGKSGAIQAVYSGAGPGIERRIRGDLTKLLNGEDLFEEPEE